MASSSPLRSNRLLSAASDSGRAKAGWMSAACAREVIAGLGETCEPDPDSRRLDAGNVPANRDANRPLDGTLPVAPNPERGEG
jgi:hypothetical protein